MIVAWRRRGKDRGGGGGRCEGGGGDVWVRWDVRKGMRDCALGIGRRRGGEGGRE